MITGMTGSGSDSQGVFPYKLEDLKAWIIRRKDGSVARFALVTAAQVAADATASTSVRSMGQGYTSMYGPNSTSGRVTSSFGDYCSHKPGEIAAAVFPRAGADPLRLWVASMQGARATRDTFDFVVDCGDIFTEWHMPGKVLSGDPELSQLLQPWIVKQESARILKIDWDDRQAPTVEPEFWTQLNKTLSGDVMTCCVGGHGRSGTSFVCLLLNNAPDYDALDAIVHLRAVHCTRAIESVSQHEYINEVAKHLGREANAKLSHDIKDYKAAFTASQKPTAIKTKKRLEWVK